MPSQHRSKRKLRRLPDEVQAAIIRRIEDRRAELDLTLDQVLEMIGIGRSAYYNYVHNTRRLDADTMRDFELALALPASELLKIAGVLPSGIEDFASGPGAVLVAIEKDPHLGKAEKQALRKVYEGFVSTPRPRPSSPAGSRRSQAS